MNKKAHGFTIIELLIVIVVIAVLATIAIVAYNGISTRAENTKTISAVSATRKALSLYAGEKGMYTSDTYACVGVGPCARVSGSTLCLGTGGVATMSTFDAEIREVVATIPVPSSQRVRCDSNGAEYVGIFVYSYNSRRSATLYWYLKGADTACGIAGTTRATDGEVVRCALALPTV